MPNQPPIAIGSRLARFPQIKTLGVRPNLDDYPREERLLMHRADTIYYPTTAFAAQFHTQGKKIFPSLETHLYEGDKIKQTTLLKVFELPHPRTRVFYGTQRRDILKHFNYPFVAKIPRASACGKGVFLIKNHEQLEDYLAQNKPAYIQEYLKVEADVRVVVIGRDPVLSYVRRPAPGEWRANISQGAAPDFSGVPPAAVALAVQAARLTNLDDVGVDVVMAGGKPMILEFNIKYGRRGAKVAGMDLQEVVARKILRGEL